MGRNTLDRYYIICQTLVQHYHYSNQAQKKLVANALFKGASHAMGLGFDRNKAHLAHHGIIMEGYVKLMG